MYLLKSLFILTIILFVFGEVMRMPVALLSVKLIDIGVILLSAYWVLFTIKNLKKIKINKDLRIPVLIFSTVALLSLILNARLLNINELFVSSLYFIRWISYASIIFIILVGMNIYIDFFQHFFILILPVHSLFCIFFFS